LEQVRAALHNPGPERLLYIADAFRFGLSVLEVHQLTGIDPWFLEQGAAMIATGSRLFVSAAAAKAAKQSKLKQINATEWKKLKQQGFNDRRLAQLFGVTEQQVRAHRLAHGIKPVFQRVDSCAGEFAATTAYMYSTYQDVCEARIEDVPKVVIIGSGPNRIGQGIEFDYCCVHAAYALNQAGYQSIMINCNPETVSTDYDTADRLYFEPLSEEHVLAILDAEKPDGVIVQLGGQTPLKLAHAIEQASYKILGTPPNVIDLAEDRAQFSNLISTLGLRQPACVVITDLEQGIHAANELVYPLLVRPSYVLGGQAMEIVHDPESLEHYLVRALSAAVDKSVLIDQFLDNAIEVDVDAICDGSIVLIVGVMEHIEQAGVHSGDSACSLPPFSLSTDIQHELCRQTTKLALGLGVIGVMNVQFAIQNNQIYVLEVNPRASRTMPFVAKATGVPVIKMATEVMLGQSLNELLSSVDAELLTTDIYRLPTRGFAVKFPVFPFIKFPGVDPVLGPEMKSTGEVMGRADNFARAYGKAMLAAGLKLPKPGRAVISVRDEDKMAVMQLARRLIKAGFTIEATYGTWHTLKAARINCSVISKIHEGRPNVVDLIKNDEVTFIINTASDRHTIADSAPVRRTALQHHVCCATTLAGAMAIIQAIECGEDYTYTALQG
ncbi:MAG: carbamoyl-phosphate synthase large subunit, partial [Gammaproteobacteria bacterium]